MQENTRKHNFKISMDKGNNVIISTKRKTQTATGGRSFVGYYGSMPCYEDDYDEFDYELEISLNEMREDLEDLDYFIDNLKVDISTVESVTKMFDFIYAYTDYYNDIEDYLNEKANERAEEDRENERLSAEEDACEERCEARAERFYDMFD